MNAMKSNSRKIRKEGWRTGSVMDFLKLSDEEAVLVEMRTASRRDLRGRARSRGSNRKMK